MGKRKVQAEVEEEKPKKNSKKVIKKEKKKEKKGKKDKSKKKKAKEEKEGNKEGGTTEATSIKVEKIDTVDVSDEAAGEDVPMAVDGTEKEKEASPEEIIQEDQ